MISYCPNEILKRGIKLSKKELYVEYPIITTSPVIANLLSVLSSDKRTYTWICNNFNQIVYIKDQYNTDFKNLGTLFEHHPRENNTIYSELPFLKSNKIKKELLNNLCTDFGKFVIESINENYYIRVPLNLKYISISKNFMIKDVMHPTFIYGYDTDEQKIYLGEFYNSTKYDYYKLPIADIINAYNNSIKPNSIQLEYYEDIILFKINNDYNDYFIDTNLIKESLCDYIKMVDNTNKYKNSFRWRECSFYYGLSYYDELVKDIEYNQADLRSIHALYDYMKIISFKIELLFELGFITNVIYKNLTAKIRTCIDLSLINRNKYIKILQKNFDIKNRKDLADKKMLIDNYFKLKTISKELTEEIIDLL